MGTLDASEGTAEHADKGRQMSANGGGCQRKAALGCNRRAVAAASNKRRLLLLPAHNMI